MAGTGAVVETIVLTEENKRISIEEFNNLGMFTKSKLILQNGVKFLGQNGQKISVNSAIQYLNSQTQKSPRSTGISEFCSKVKDASTFNMLIVDDSATARFSLCARLRNSFPNIKLFEARDGKEALEVMLGTGTKPPIPHPYLVFTDLEMPVVGGLKFLENVRANSKVRNAVVFIVTTSEAQSDRSKAMALGAADYVVKDKLAEDFPKLIKLIERYRKNLSR